MSQSMGRSDRLSDMIEASLGAWPGLAKAGEIACHVVLGGSAACEQPPAFGLGKPRELAVSGFWVPSRNVSSLRLCGPASRPYARSSRCVATVDLPRTSYNRVASSGS
jgi:hypothetical protein